MVRFTIALIGTLFAIIATRTAAAPYQLRQNDNPNSDQLARVVFDRKVKGTITFEGFDDGSTLVTAEIVEGLNDPTAEYKYHIHENPVSSNDTGDCMSTGTHLSPNGYPDAAMCDPQNPFSCQEGDLSGKHGTFKGSPDGSASAEYSDQFLRWDDPKATILGRSVVIHYPNGTRMACANIVDVSKDKHGHANDTPDNGDGNDDGDYATCDDDDTY